jgi:hypothetical protein
MNRVVGRDEGQLVEASCSSVAGATISVSARSAGRARACKLMREGAEVGTVHPDEGPPRRRRLIATLDSHVLVL